MGYGDDTGGRAYVGKGGIAGRVLGKIGEVAGVAAFNRRQRGLERESRKRALVKQIEGIVLAAQRGTFEQKIALMRRYRGHVKICRVCGKVYSVFTDRKKGEKYGGRKKRYCSDECGFKGFMRERGEHGGWADNGGRPENVKWDEMAAQRIDELEEGERLEAERKREEQEAAEKAAYMACGGDEAGWAKKKSHGAAERIKAKYKAKMLEVIGSVKAKKPRVRDEVLGEEVAYDEGEEEFEEGSEELEEMLGKHNIVAEEVNGKIVYRKRGEYWVIRDRRTGKYARFPEEGEESASVPGHGWLVGAIKDATVFADRGEANRVCGVVDESWLDVEYCKWRPFIQQMSMEEVEKWERSRWKSGWAEGKMSIGDSRIGMKVGVARTGARKGEIGFRVETKN